MNIQLAGTVQNTGVWKFYFSADKEYVNIYDKQWGDFIELNGDKAKELINSYNDKVANYLTTGTKEYDMTLDSILAGIYYKYK